MNELIRAILGPLLFLTTATHLHAQSPTPTFRVAAAKVDITPPAGTPVVGHIRPVNGVRDPLHVALLLLDDGRAKAAIVTLDLLNAGDDLTARLRQAVNAATEIPAEHIMVAASHNHS